MEWISVNDHLPEDDKTLFRHKETHMEVMSVLAAGYLSEDSKKKTVAEVNRLFTSKTGIPYIDNEIGEGWRWSTRFYQVTDWMPLPEPPK